MHVDDLILVSIDDHLVEPPTMFDAHTSARVRGRALLKRFPDWELDERNIARRRSDNVRGFARLPLELPV